MHKAALVLRQDRACLNSTKEVAASQVQRFQDQTESSTQICECQSVNGYRRSLSALYPASLVAAVHNLNTACSDKAANASETWKCF